MCSGIFIIDRSIVMSDDLKWMNEAYKQAKNIRNTSNL